MTIATRKVKKLVRKENIIASMVIIVLPIVVAVLAFSEAILGAHNRTGAKNITIIAFVIALGVLFIFWGTLFTSNKWGKKNIKTPVLELKDDNYIIHNRSKVISVPARDIVEVSERKGIVYLTRADKVSYPLLDIENVDSTINIVSEKCKEQTSIIIEKK